MKRFSNFFSVFFFVAASAAMAHAQIVLFSTGYEAPQYSSGPLSGQNGWENSFGIDPVVTDFQPRTGTQGLEIRKIEGGDGFGLTFREGPYLTSLPKIVVEHSIYLPGSTGWDDSFLSPMALQGENGFIGQIGIRNGATAQLFNSGDDFLETPISVDQWIDLRLVLDFTTQTQEAFINGSSIGSLAFRNAATELQRVEIFHIIGTDNNPFYVDDLRITAIPEPTAMGLSVVGLSIMLLRRRRN